MHAVSLPYKVGLSNFVKVRYRNCFLSDRTYSQKKNICKVTVISILFCIVFLIPVSLKKFIP